MTRRSRVRLAVGSAVRRLQGVAQHGDPSRLLLRPARPAEPVALVCVYRGRNAGVVRELLGQLPPGSTTALWSLDGEVPPDLATCTAGTGPGSRSALLNRLVETVEAAGDPVGDLVLCDDDVRLVVGDLGRLLDAGRRLRLDVYQPAHLASSLASWDFVRRRSWTFGRVTGFVEQGPLLVLSPAGREVVLPLPEDIGMAWGVEARWSAAARRAGVRLGIVDAVAVRHLSPPATDYDRGPQEAVLREELRRAGLESLDDLHVVHERVGLAGGWRLRSAGGPS